MTTIPLQAIGVNSQARQRYAGVMVKHLAVARAH
jgi:hypothetical protein